MKKINTISGLSLLLLFAFFTTQTHANIVWGNKGNTIYEVSGLQKEVGLKNWGALVPANLTASDGLYSDRVIISWKKMKNAESYTVLKSTSADGIYQAIGSTITTNLTDLDVTIDISYYYKVQAYQKDKGFSALSTSDAGSSHYAAIVPSVTIVKTTNSFTATWPQAPAPNGVTITGYIVNYDNVDQPVQTNRNFSKSNLLMKSIHTLKLKYKYNTTGTSPDGSLATIKMTYQDQKYVTDFTNTIYIDNATLTYHYYLPDITNRALPVLIYEGGLNGDEAGTITSSLYKDFADQYHVGLLTISFQNISQTEFDTFHSYHYAQAWSGVMMTNILAKIQQQNNLYFTEYYMNGISAGAQFITRFGLYFPKKVRAIWAHAPGGLDSVPSFPAINHINFTFSVGTLDVRYTDVYNYCGYFWSNYQTANFMPCPGYDHYPDPPYLQGAMIYQMITVLTN